MRGWYRAADKGFDSLQWGRGCPAAPEMPPCATSKADDT